VGRGNEREAELELVEDEVRLRAAGDGRLLEAVEAARRPARGRGPLEDDRRAAIGCAAGGGPVKV
jgi:hypothetical protein